MIKLNINNVATLLFMMIFACANLALADSNVDILKKELASLNLDDPVQDLEKNWAQGDRRFIAVYGYTTTLPGVDDYAIVIFEKYGYRAIEGTSDVREGEEHTQLIKLAKVYAKAYNMKLLEKLKKEEKLSP